MRGPKNPSQKRAKGKVCIITGGTKGIGREIAREMAIRGIHLVTHNAELNLFFIKIVGLSVLDFCLHACWTLSSKIDKPTRLKFKFWWLIDRSTGNYRGKR